MPKSDRSLKLLASFALFALISLGTANAGSDELWAIGHQDGMSIEFAPGARDQLTFVIGKNVASRDFAGHQAGAAGIGEHPYTIAFDLSDPPAGSYELTLDLIFRAGAPREMKVSANGRDGIFPIRLNAYKNDGNRGPGNDMLLARQHLVIPIKAAWLKQKENKITLAPLGIGSLDYDALSLRKADGAAPPEKLRLDPTLFFRRGHGKLMEICDVVIPFDSRFHSLKATATLGNESFTTAGTNSLFDFGVWRQQLEIPADQHPGDAKLEVALDGHAERVVTTFQPAKQWKVFICPKVHNDIGYTDLQPHVNELDNRNTDTVLDILQKYPFYKFNFETSWLVDNYLDCRSPEYRKRFFDFAAKDRATVNALYLNLMTGVCSGEELHRALYFTHELHRRHGSNFDFACLTDAPSHSWFLPSLLSGVGIKAFSNGSNQTRAPILQFSSLNEDSPYYWEGMDGERIMMWYAHSYLQLSRLVGSAAGLESNLEYLQATVPQFLTRYLRAEYVPDATMIYGAYVDNAAIPKTAEAPLIAQWNQQFEFPKLIVASDADYFNYIEKHFAGKLPKYRGDCGAYWEDGVGSSAKATTLNRRTQQLLPTAETLAAWATLLEPRNRYPAEDFRNAWKNVMFYDEHTWGAHNSVSQPDREFVTRQWEIKESYAVRANLDARNLLARGLNRFCQEISVSGNSIIAINCQNAIRSAPLEAEVDNGVQVIDLTANKPVELDEISATNGCRKVRFLADDVPTMGFKTYALRHTNSPTKANQKVAGETIESKFYRLTVDKVTGGLKSLYDKTAQRELADTRAPYKLNEYLYVNGGENSLILNHAFGSPPANLTINEPVLAEIIETVKTPLGQRIVVESKSKNTPKVRSEYLVYDNFKRVDIVNTVQKDETRAKEAVYFAFPFAAEKPALDYQIQNGWVRPNEDQLPGACREWFTTQNLVRMRDSGFSVAWSTPDAPLVTLTDINRGKWLTHLPITNGHVYSYAMNNYWFTNYRAEQGGSFTFHYSITSGANVSEDEIARFDTDTRIPVFAYPFLSSFSAKIAQEGRRFPAASGSLLTLDAPDLQLVTFKAAEDGDGYILRLRETAGHTGEADLKLPVLRVLQAQLCNGVEENQRKLVVTGNALRVPYQPHQFITLRIRAEAVGFEKRKAESQSPDAKAVRGKKQRPG